MNLRAESEFVPFLTTSFLLNQAKFRVMGGIKGGIKGLQLGKTK